jgi:hypothetical protein
VLAEVTRGAQQQVRPRRGERGKYRGCRYNRSHRRRHRYRPYRMRGGKARLGGDTAGTVMTRRILLIVRLMMTAMVKMRIRPGVNSGGSIEKMRVRRHRRGL